MADSKQPQIFSNLPLEVRHKIFEYVAIRATKPKKLLRYWFEKKEASELAAEHIAANPGCLAPILVYPDAKYDPPDSDDESVDEEGDSDGYGESDEGSDDDNNDDGEDESDGEDDNLSDEDDISQDGEAVESSGMAAGTIRSPTSSTATQTLPPAPVFRPQLKWRHIPNFMRITHCPPPIELFLTCKQLNEEAKDWFYDVSLLRIEATGSFAHTSFFEEAFSQITDAAFSPMENIRKVEIMFVWDTTWIRADKTGSVEAIFPALLRQRSEFVVSILAKAPTLRDVTIHWHDSAQDDESTNFMNDVLVGFLNLPAKVKVKEHYISAETNPIQDSIAGKRRVEFQNIVDRGLDRLL